MKRHLDRRSAGLVALVVAAALPIAPAAAGEPLPDRPGFGYVIHFTTGTAAEALLPVARRPLPDRPGFGYAINFVPGDPEESLYPPGWVRQRAIALASSR